MRILRRLLVVTGLVAGITILNCGQAMAFGKIYSTPASVTLAEGASTTVTLRLDAPIICPLLSPTCQVDLHFHSSNPSQLSSSPFTITWQYTEWAQTRTLTIDSIDDGIYTGDQNLTLTATAVSNSIYYSDYIISIPVTLTEASLPPAPAISDKTVDVKNDGKTTRVDVLAGLNDIDPGTLEIVSGPAHGKATIGSIDYTPNKGFVGHDSVTYRVCSSLNNTVCSTAVLGFNVLADSPETGYGKPDNNFAAYLSIASGLVVVAAVMRKRLVN
ncbi:MAG: Ig-like domain-containing protein [Candidatus Saccharimonadales bacterium]